MNRHQLRTAKLQLKRDNSKASTDLTEVNKSLWPQYNLSNLVNVFRSKTFMVQLFEEKNATRLTICRTAINNDGTWKANITWEELQEIKKQVGFGDSFAVEIFPKDKNIVNVANMRHLWIPDFEIELGWTK